MNHIKGGELNINTLSEELSSINRLIQEVITRYNLTSGVEIIVHEGKSIVSLDMDKVVTALNTFL